MNPTNKPASGKYYRATCKTPTGDTARYYPTLAAAKASRGAYFIQGSGGLGSWRKTDGKWKKGA